MFAPCSSRCLTISRWPICEAKCRGVHDEPLPPSMFAPLSSRCLTISRWPICEAHCRGVRDEPLPPSMFAPFSSRCLTISRWPCCEADCRGVHVPSPPSMFAPFSSRCSTISRWPFCEAHCRGVHDEPSPPSMFAPCSSRCLTISRWPLPDAICNGVILLLVWTSTLAPALMSISAARTDPLWQAKCKAVLPSGSTAWIECLNSSSLSICWIVVIVLIFPCLQAIMSTVSEQAFLESGSVRGCPVRYFSTSLFWPSWISFSRMVGSKSTKVLKYNLGNTDQCWFLNLLLNLFKKVVCLCGTFCFSRLYPALAFCVHRNSGKYAGWF